MNGKSHPIQLKLENGKPILQPRYEGKLIKKSKGNKNAHWWRTNERKDSNAMDVDAFNHGRKGNIVEAREVLLLQEDWAHGKRLPTRTGAILKTEEGGPGKICLHHDQSTYQGAESFTKMVMEDKDQEDF
jgi:hypothetical protein